MGSQSSQEMGIQIPPFHPPTSCASTVTNNRVGFTFFLFQSTQWHRIRFVILQQELGFPSGKPCPRKEQAMRILFVIGILLIVLGVMALGYQSVTFFTHERVAEAGPFHVDVAKPHTIVFNPIVGAVALAGGVILLLASRRSSSL
jgi:hypothetical protein